MLGMLAVFAQMECDFNSERTRAALDNKREQGITGGVRALWMPSKPA